MQTAQELRQILSWHIDAGVDEAIAEVATNRFMPLVLPTAAPPPPAAQPQPNQRFIMNTSPLTNGTLTPPSAAIAQAEKIAAEVTTLEELKAAVQAFDGCLLKRTATNTVFADGNPNASVMVIGEAPGEQEDLSGVPFCGRSGQLLDNVLKSIGLTRAENVYISNTIFWRPPGNRTPSPEEVAICAPLVKKHIALKKPKLIILAGGVASNVLNSNLSVSKLRGKFHDYHNDYLDAPIPAVVIYHPSYLLRQPGQKAQAWKDMLMVQKALESQKS